MRTFLAAEDHARLRIAVRLMLALVLTFVVLMWIAAASHAQGAAAGAAAPSTAANFQAITDFFLSLVAAAVTGAIPVVVPAVLRRLKVADNAALTANLDMGLHAAAGLAYKYATEHDGGLADVNVHNAALAAGVNHVLAGFPETLKAQGITQDRVQSMVAGRLGVLLAADPTVTAGKAALAAAAPATQPANAAR